MKKGEFATCKYCGKEMVPGSTCEVQVLRFANGKEYERIPFTASFDGEVCHDCNAGDGCLHHLGCDNEKCPKCGGQFISCDCD